MTTPELERRELVAKIIDPYAFRPNVEYDRLDEAYQAKARAKADTIIAALTPNP